MLSLNYVLTTYKNSVESKVIRRYKVEKCINRLKQAQQHVEKFKWNKQAGRFSTYEKKTVVCIGSFCITTK